MIPPFRKSNPLAVALGTNESSALEARPSFPSPRFVTLMASELPENIRPGDTVLLSAYVRSMDMDGNVEVAIKRVVDKPQDQKIWVTPPESPTP